MYEGDLFIIPLMTNNFDRKQSLRSLFIYLFLFFGIFGGLEGNSSLYASKNNPLEPVPIPNMDLTPNTHFLFQDSKGFIWICARHGLFRYDGYNFKNYNSTSHRSTPLGEYLVITMYEDKEGVMWFGTAEGGLIRWDLGKNRFTRYYNRPNDPESISFDTVRFITEDRADRLWVATENGLNCLDEKSGRFSRFYFNPGYIDEGSTNRLWSIFIDSRERFWITTWDDGLYLFNPEKKHSVESVRPLRRRRTYTRKGFERCARIIPATFGSEQCMDCGGFPGKLGKRRSYRTV